MKKFNVLLYNSISSGTRQIDDFYGTVAFENVICERTRTLLANKDPVLLHLPCHFKYVRQKFELILFFLISLTYYYRVTIDTQEIPNLINTKLPRFDFRVFKIVGVDLVNDTTSFVVLDKGNLQESANNPAARAILKHHKNMNTSELVNKLVVGPINLRTSTKHKCVYKFAILYKNDESKLIVATAPKTQHQVIQFITQMKTLCASNL